MQTSLQAGSSSTAAILFLSLISSALSGVILQRSRARLSCWQRLQGKRYLGKINVLSQFHSNSAMFQLMYVMPGNTQER